MALNKKPITQVRDRIAYATIDQLSKACLADIVVDLLRQNKGDERLDGGKLIEALIEAHGPIATARGEKPLKMWKSRAGRASRAAECGCGGFGYRVVDAAVARGLIRWNETRQRYEAV